MSALGKLVNKGISHLSHTMQSNSKSNNNSGASNNSVQKNGSGSNSNSEAKKNSGSNSSSASNNNSSTSNNNSSTSAGKAAVVAAGSALICSPAVKVAVSLISSPAVNNVVEKNVNTAPKNSSGFNNNSTPKNTNGTNNNPVSSNILPKTSPALAGSVAVQAGAAALISNPTAKMGLSIIVNTIGKEIVGKENGSLTKGSTGSGSNVAEKSSVALNNNAGAKNGSVAKATASSISSSRGKCILSAKSSSSSKSSSSAKSSSGSAYRSVLNLMKAPTKNLSSIAPNSGTKVNVNDHVKAVVNSTAGTISKTNPTLSNTGAKTVSEGSTSVVTYAGRYPDAIEFRNGGSVLPSNMFTTKPDDRLVQPEQQEQLYYDRVRNALGVDSSKTEKKSDGNSTENNSKFTTKVEVSDKYSSKKETTDKSSTSTVIYPSDTNSSNKQPTGKQTTKDKIINGAGALFQGMVDLGTVAMMSGDPCLLDNALGAVVKGAGTVGKAVLNYGDDIVKGGKAVLNYGDDIVKGGDDVLKTTETASKYIDETKEIEVAAKSGIEGGSKTINTLTDAQKSRLNSLENTINDHLTEGDFSGTLRDLQGNPVPNGKGGYFDHLGEMKDSYAALNKIKKGLEGSLKNPNLSKIDRTLLQEGLDDANSYILRIEETFKPFGGIN